jgi:hypothetical protein
LAGAGGLFWTRFQTDLKVTFSQALLKDEDFLGTFRLGESSPTLVEAYSGIIENEDGTEN